MDGMPRSLWSVEFDTYRGASAIDRSILGWHLCRMAILELLAQPHSSMPLLSYLDSVIPKNMCVYTEQLRMQNTQNHTTRT